MAFKKNKEATNKERRNLFTYLEKRLIGLGLPPEKVENITTHLDDEVALYQKVLPSEKQIPMREVLQVVKEKGNSDSTDLSLMVTTPTSGLISKWDRKKIVEALMLEAEISQEKAEEIATAVEERVFTSDIKTISVSLIRELVDNELFARGYQTKLKKQESLGMPSYNIRKLIFSKTAENANVNANNPEAVNLAIAEYTLKQYALQNIFTKDLAEAHLKGVIHLHDLGYPVRVYCSAHSLEYLKKYGLRLINLSTSSTPARHAMTLIGHLNTFLASMQAYYAGALGIGHINIFFAPLVKDMSYKEMKQAAQYLIFSCSQNAFSRGGQTLFVDFNVHLGVPSYLKEVPAIGPRGKYMLKKPDGQIEFLDEVPRDKKGAVRQPKKGRILTYKDFEHQAQKFAKAMMDVWREGDADGKVFPFPKMDLHIDQQSFDDPKQFKLLRYACQVASENGTPYFIFDRDEVVLSACCRLRTEVRDNYVLYHPESMRFCGFQNVTINLPQAAYRACQKLGKKKDKKNKADQTIQEIEKTMELAMKAHLQKKKFIEKMMSEPGSPMWQVGSKGADGRRYIDLDRADTSYIIGMIGLNECVKHLTGSELHENDEAYKLGLKIISAMFLKSKKFEKKYGFSVKLEESPAESASLRLAKVDLKEYPKEAKKMVQGNQKSGEVYYTNSIHFTPDAPIDIIQRIIGQGKFHNLIEAGAITHVFVGEENPSSESILNLVKKTWQDTQTAQLTISPEFTVCRDCGKVSRGYQATGEEEVPTCSYCGSKNVYGISRIVGYFSQIDNWNKSKTAEFRDRQKGNYKV
jgi:ribonucleoside-triphosphate reductase (formate)